MQGDVPNAILTFRDEDGNEWMAAAVIGPLLRTARAGAPLVGRQAMHVEEIKDLAWRLQRLTIVSG